MNYSRTGGFRFFRRFPMCMLVEQKDSVDNRCPLSEQFTLVLWSRLISFNIPEQKKKTEKDKGRKKIIIKYWNENSRVFSETWLSGPSTSIMCLFLLFLVAFLGTPTAVSSMPCHKANLIDMYDITLVYHLLLNGSTVFEVFEINIGQFVN